jgi:hypothetical protein
MDPHDRQHLAERLHTMLLREIGHGVDPRRMLADALYARDVLLVCDAHPGSELAATADQYRRAAGLPAAPRRPPASAPVAPQSAAARIERGRPAAAVPVRQPPVLRSALPSKPEAGAHAAASAATARASSIERALLHGLPGPAGNSETRPGVHLAAERALSAAELSLPSQPPPRLWQRLSDHGGLDNPETWPPEADEPDLGIKAPRPATAGAGAGPSSSAADRPRSDPGQRAWFSPSRWFGGR